MKQNNRQAAAVRAIRHQLRKAGQFDSLDGAAVYIAAATFCEFERLQIFTNRMGSTYETMGREGDLIQKHRPEHQQLQAARSFLLSALKELGMTPASRQKFTQTPEEVDILAEILNS